MRLNPHPVACDRSANPGTADTAVKALMEIFFTP